MSNRRLDQVDIVTFGGTANEQKGSYEMCKPGAGKQCSRRVIQHVYESNYLSALCVLCSTLRDSLAFACILDVFTQNFLWNDPGTRSTDTLFFDVCGNTKNCLETNGLDR